MQGSVLGGDKELLETTLAHIAFCTAYGSLVVGSVPAFSHSAVANAVADVGLLGSVYDAKDHVPQERLAGSADAEDAAPHVVFSSQQTKLSLAEVELYEDHVEAYEEGDEDVNDEFRRL